MLKKYLKLTWKSFGISLLVFVGLVILHNLVSALFGVEEGFFFILAVFGVPLYLLSSVIFTFVNLLSKNRSKKK